MFRMAAVGFVMLCVCERERERERKRESIAKWQSTVARASAR